MILGNLGRLEKLGNCRELVLKLLKFPNLLNNPIKNNKGS
jgi:hypothetical protein